LFSSPKRRDLALEHTQAFWAVDIGALPRCCSDGVVKCAEISDKWSCTFTPTYLYAFIAWALPLCGKEFWLRFRSGGKKICIFYETRKSLSCSMDLPLVPDTDLDKSIPHTYIYIQFWD
jgi:hypothetical protein